MYPRSAARRSRLQPLQQRHQKYLSDVPTSRETCLCCSRVRNESDSNVASNAEETARVSRLARQFAWWTPASPNALQSAFTGLTTLSDENARSIQLQLWNDRDERSQYRSTGKRYGEADSASRRPCHFKTCTKLYVGILRGAYV
jgi:hypothetical protein